MNGPAQAPAGARARAEALGYSEADLRRLREMAGAPPLESPADIRRVLDNFRYLDDWRSDYRIQSVRSSLSSGIITCIDGAILSYGLLELLFPETQRRLLAIHRRDPKKDEECGHCVALYWTPDGRVGSFSKSSYPGLGHREPTFADEVAVATSYAEAYVAMQFQPLYFGVTTLEAAAPDLDWRFHAGPLNEISSRLQASYEYGFKVGGKRVKPAPALDFPGLLEQLAARGAKPALSFYAGRSLVDRLSHRELHDLAESLAQALRSRHGVERGDRVAILAPNRIEIPVLLLALLRLGAVAVPLNPASAVEDWGYILGHSRSRGLCATRELAERAAPVTASLFKLPVEELLGLAALAPSPAVPAETQPLTEAPAVVLYTSGTTGAPKGVVLRQRNLIANAWSMAQNFGFDGTTQLAVLPLYHAHAFGFGLMTALSTGGHLVFTERLDPFTWAAVIRAEAVSVTSVVPTMLPMLLAAGISADKVPSLRHVMVSSAPLASALARDFEARTRLALVQGWGLSEYTNFACCMDPWLPTEAHAQLMAEEDVPSVGPALPGTEVRVIASDGTPESTTASEGQRGELQIRGHSTMLGYLDDPQATAAVLDGEGWLRTGDEGFFRNLGGRAVYFISGRIKELIIRDAEKYSPLRLERALTDALPELAGRLVVLGFAHADHGEEVGAYLEIDALDEGLRARLTTAIQAMPIATRPKVVLHGAMPIPRTHTGKVQRRRMQAWFDAWHDHRGALIFSGRG